MRPAEFARYDYTQENYTGLLWFFEGFTSYYDDLFLVRTGLIDRARYLTLLARTVTGVLASPGRQVQSVAQASFDAWVKYYRQDENSANATISYYTKGALVALCLDLSLRRGANSSLDAVMRGLWQRCQGGPMTEADLLVVLRELSGRSWDGEIAAWVHGKAELPLQDLLAGQGVDYREEKAALAEQLGIKVSDANGLRIKSVLRNSAAEAAGLAAGDEWLGIEVGQGKAQTSWRLNKLDELPLYLGQARDFGVLVARDQRLMHLRLSLPQGVKQVKLNPGDPARLALWLGKRLPAPQ
jgi:predicted metalloprotease with PDZ domain